VRKVLETDTLGVDSSATTWHCFFSVVVCGWGGLSSFAGGTFLGFRMANRAWWGFSVDEDGIVGLKGSGGSCGWASSGSFTAFRMTAKAKAQKQKQRQKQSGGKDYDKVRG
jgi:hypothetical protein